MATQPRYQEGRPTGEPMGTMITDPRAWGLTGQWGSMFAGAFAGFAAFILLAVLGLAIGITAGQPLAVEQIGIAAGVWWMLMLLTTGLFGGWVLGRTARADRVYNAGIYGTVTWVLGTVILLVLLAFGVGNIIGGVGGAVGQVMAAQELPAAEQVQVVGVATPVAWILFGSMVIGLGATILGAFLGRPEPLHTTTTGATTATTGTTTPGAPRLRE